MFNPCKLCAEVNLKWLMKQEHLNFSLEEDLAWSLVFNNLKIHLIENVNAQDDLQGCEVLLNKFVAISCIYEPFFLIACVLCL